MIFKKAYRKIELNDDYTMKELCDQMNKIFNSNLYSTINNDRITVNKKYFSDFFPFNLGHLASMTIHAKSIKTESDSKNLEFVIEMDDWTKFSTYGGIIFLTGFSILMLLILEIWLVCGGVIFIILLLLLSNVMHNLGVANLTKNWDKHIGTKV